MAQPYIEQKSVNTIVLMYFFNLAQADDALPTDVQVIKYFNGKIGKIRMQMAFEYLVKVGYVKDVSPNDAYIYQITNEGYARAEELFLKPDGNVQKLIEVGFDAYFDRLKSTENLHNDEEQIPAADRYVTLSDNMAGYDEVVGTVEQAIENIRGANDLAAEEKSWIKIHVELGFELIKKGGKVLISAIRSLIIEPLQEAMKESSQEGMRIALSAALKAIKTYFGIS